MHQRASTTKRQQLAYSQAAAAVTALKLCTHRRLISVSMESEVGTGATESIQLDKVSPQTLRPTDTCLADVQIALARRAAAEIFLNRKPSRGSTELVQATATRRGFNRLFSMAELVSDHVSDAYRSVKELLTENRQCVEAVARELLERGTLTGAEVEALVAQAG